MNYSIKKCEKNKMKELDFSTEQIDLLSIIVEMIIPKSEEHDMPSGNDVLFHKYIIENELGKSIKENFNMIFEQAKEVFQKDFSELSMDERNELINQRRKKQRRFFNDFAKHLFQCYYTNSSVQQAIGLTGKAPFPEGFFMKESDFSHLESVYNRGKIYID